MNSFRKTNRTYRSLPGAHWLPERIARIPVSIKTKLLVAFLGVAALLVVLGTVGLGTLRIANERTAELAQQQKLIAAYRKLNYDATQLLFYKASAILAEYGGVNRYEDNNYSELGFLRSRVGFGIETVAGFRRDAIRGKLVPEEDLEDVRTVLADFAELIEVAKEIVKALDQGNATEAFALYGDRSLPLSKRIVRYTYTLMVEAEADMKEGAARSEQAYKSSQTMVIAASLVGIALALLLGYSLSLSLIHPVRDIQARLRSIAQGDFDGRVEVPNRDELGDLAENVNRMSRKLDQLYNELDAANRHKSEFLANMSHELRTPMNAIIGFTRLVMRRCKDVLPEKQYENLGKIKVSADNLLTLINTILDLSKIEAGRMEVYPTEFSLKPLLEACARTVEPLLDGKQVSIVSQIPDVLPVLTTDQDKMRQIVLNLLSNAAKFTEQGRIALSAAHDDDMVAISVADTGIGIPADKLPNIFEEFTQVDSNSTRRHGGTGLGLAISRHLAALLGGRVEVESSPEKGSTFTVTVPVRFVGENAGNAESREQLVS